MVDDFIIEICEYTNCTYSDITTKNRGTSSINLRICRTLIILYLRDYKRATFRQIVEFLKIPSSRATNIYSVPIRGNSQSEKEQTTEAFLWYNKRLSEYETFNNIRNST